MLYYYITTTTTIIIIIHNYYYYYKIIFFCYSNKPNNIVYSFICAHHEKGFWVSLIELLLYWLYFIRYVFSLNSLWAKSKCGQIHCCFSHQQLQSGLFHRCFAIINRGTVSLSHLLQFMSYNISLLQPHFSEQTVKSKFPSLSSDSNFDFNCSLISRHIFLPVSHHWGICAGFARKLFSKCITEQPNRDVPLLTLL